MELYLMSKRKDDAEQSKSLILDTAERLMIDEGYAAVSTRRVAAEAFLKPPLVHYYFRTTDDLFLAVFRRTSAKHKVRIRKALSTPNPLLSLWKIAVDPRAGTLTAEFNSLANHRKNIADEIAAQADEFRVMMEEGVARYLQWDSRGSSPASTIALVTLLLSAGRALVFEQSIGSSSGQAEAREVVERLIDLMEPQSEFSREAARLFSGLKAK
jgi:AcrR family transcriptional regulator